MRRLVQGGQNVRALAARIKEIEHETDVITHACVERLHKTFITPFDRDDIHRLITRMDDVMDYIESAAVAVMLYELVEMTAPARALGRRARAVDRGGRDRGRRACSNVKQSGGHPQGLHRGEPARERGRRDPPQRPRRASSARPRDPLLVLKWKEVYEALENATDRCEDVANIIEGVVLEHA